MQIRLPSPPRQLLVALWFAVLCLVCRQRAQAQCTPDELDAGQTCPSAPASAGFEPPSAYAADAVGQTPGPGENPARPELEGQTETDAQARERDARKRKNAEPAREMLREPEPLTEFQRFVAASTGELLPVFGAKLFSTLESRYTPMNQLPAPETMPVGPGDELRIRVWGQVNFSAHLTVSREGEIYIPKVGAVHVAGLMASQIESHLRSAMERIYRNFELIVEFGQLHSIQIYLTGQARQPGVYTVSAMSTMIDALFQAGGPSAAGSLRHLVLRRKGKVLADFDLYALIARGDKTGDWQLESGDILFVPAKGPEVALLGSVQRAAIYELRGNESLKDLMDIAGGQTALASGTRISIERVDQQSRRRAFALPADQGGLSTVLAAGDVIRLEPILPSFRDTVTLRGAIANPGHFQWHAGMRLSELLPDRDALVSRDYWWRRSQLGLPAPEFTPAIASLRPAKSGEEAPRAGAQPAALFGPGVAADEPAGARQPDSEPVPGGRDTIAATNLGSRTMEEAAAIRPGNLTDWNYAVIERMDPATMTTSLLPFDLGKLVLEHDAAQDLEVQPGDVVTIFSEHDIHLPQEQQTKYVRLEGEFAHAGVYSVRPGETLRSLVVRAGGLTAKAYLYGAEFTRKSTKELQQRGLNEAADQLEHQLERNSINQAADASGGSRPGEAQAMNQVLVARLRRMRATGRLVLDLRPRSAGVDALPDVPLEDGDRLVIPPTPATVQVVGAVYNPSAFFYRAQARVEDYMHLAGGPNREADKRRAYILRADGSVTGRDARQPLFASGFSTLRLNPGDTIVVPEKGLHSSSLREALAWAQIVSGFALTAVAVDALR